MIAARAGGSHLRLIGLGQRLVTNFCEAGLDSISDLLHNSSGRTILFGFRPLVPLLTVSVRSGKIPAHRRLINKCLKFIT